MTAAGFGSPPFVSLGYAMALLPLINRSNLELHVGDPDRLMQYANGNAANIEDNCAAATDMFRESALAKHTEESVDALTPTTITAGLRKYLCALVLDLMTSGGQGRPSEIAEQGENVRKWLYRLRMGHESVDGLERNSGGRVSYVAPEGKTFDRDNSCSRFNSIHESLD